MTSAKHKDAITLLKEDHRNVRSAFSKYHELGAQAYKTKKTLADQICKELVVHTRVEEEIFYPEFQKAVNASKGLVNEAKVEHDTAKDLIDQIGRMDAKDELFDAKVTVLSEYVDHHIKEEEDEMFPLLKKTSVDLADLGQRMQARKDELQ
jgi:hemerythrin-like domain-containing protein